jgi:membrane-associated phospholipid phosphatase
MARDSGGLALQRLMRTISNAGGRDLALVWVPVTLLMLLVLGHARSLRFFLAAMFGTVGLEGFFKALIHRARPDPRHGAHFASYPSGHALAATVLAGALLVIWLPRCHRFWQRALLWSAAVAWSLLMSAARVYLDCHYVTDVAGGILLGAAWTCFCQGLLLALARRSRTVPEARTAVLAGETTRE